MSDSTGLRRETSHADGILSSSVLKIGSTKNLQRRLPQHQQGLGAKYTSRRLPVKLVYFEEYERVADAYYREKQVQNWSRAKREALINGEYEKLTALAKKKFQKQSVGRVVAP
ncbi:MAG: GIY-YIG nuclease family protein [Chloroflexota bacterium]|jgi:putative endonuclease